MNDWEGDMRYHDGSDNNDPRNLRSNMSYNNNRGNYGRQGSYNRGGGNGRANNRGNNGANDKYVNASSVKKEIDDGNQKHRVDFEAEGTEIIGFSLTGDKAADLVGKIQQAMADAEGDGGVYFNMYMSRKQNGRTGETFDGLRILVNKKNPPQEGGFQRGGGSFNGGNGGGRRDYNNGQSRTTTTTRHADSAVSQTTQRTSTAVAGSDNTHVFEPEF